VAVNSSAEVDGVAPNHGAAGTPSVDLNDPESAARVADRILRGPLRLPPGTPPHGGPNEVALLLSELDPETRAIITANLYDAIDGWLQTWSDAIARQKKLGLAATKRRQIMAAVIRANRDASSRTREAPRNQAALALGAQSVAENAVVASSEEPGPFSTLAARTAIGPGNALAPTAAAGATLRPRRT